VARSLDQPEIELEGRYLARNGLGVGDGDLQVEAGTRGWRQSAAESGHDRRQQVDADSGAGADTQAADLRLTVLRPALDRVGTVE